MKKLNTPVNWCSKYGSNPNTIANTMIPNYS